MQVVEEYMRPYCGYFQIDAHDPFQTDMMVLCLICLTFLLDRMHTWPCFFSWQMQTCQVKKKKKKDSPSLWKFHGWKIQQKTTENNANFNIKFYLSIIRLVCCDKFRLVKCSPNPESNPNFMNFSVPGWCTCTQFWLTHSCSLCQHLWDISDGSPETCVLYAGLDFSWCLSAVLTQKICISHDWSSNTPFAMRFPQH